jgi:DMSO/TMAO reductase YedYZ molybdopterin-dependent catalytic subunit
MAPRLLTTVALLGLLGAWAASGCAGPVARHATPVAPGTSQSATPPPIPTAAERLATAPPVADLGNVEVRSYKGARLDAVSSEPENSIKGPQHVDIKTYRLEVTGLVAKPLSLTYADVTAMPAYQKATTLNCVDGWSVTYLWQGVLLKDLLARAGFDPGARIVIFRCADGYSESLPVDFVLGRDILLAYRMNGVVMPPERGFPFQVVAEDRLGYKWAKWVTGIEVSGNTRFAGYWESRGADNTATLPGTN